MPSTGIQNKDYEKEYKQLNRSHMANIKDFSHNIFLISFDLSFLSYLHRFVHKYPYLCIGCL